MISDPENPTTLLAVNRNINPKEDYQIYLKLERFNPCGSIKDRTALNLLEGTEIKNGKTIVEPSSGNTGIALASIANAMGIPLEIAIPSGAPEEKKVLLKLLGVNLWEADDDLCPLYPNEGARGLVKGILAGKGGEDYVSPNQYENPLNAMAHYNSTGPEIWKQTEGKINYFFAGFGTCGTISGVGKYLKEQNPDIKIIGVEPKSRNHNLAGMKKISNLPEELIPEILNRDVIDDILEVEDDQAYQTAIDLARKTGILMGPTTGAVLFSALKHSKENQGLAVVIAPDDAFKYVSLFADYLKD